MTNSRKEIKIIISETGYIHPASVLVTIDDEPIGCIQEIIFNANVDSPICNLDIVFPDLKSNKIDQEAYNAQPNLISTIDHHVEILKDIPGINIHMKDIFGA
jgi:hypothetical protein